MQECPLNFSTGVFSVRMPSENHKKIKQKVSPERRLQAKRPDDME